MELKNALSVCLIALFSSTLVVLIARSLDSQAAARLEPQLARIATELEALRAGGGLSASVPTSAAPIPALRDGVMVYYFHGNTRCPTCRSIEAQTFSVVQTDFAAQLDGGTLRWQTLNYEDNTGAALAKTYEVTTSSVVLTELAGGKVVRSKRLDEVWALVGDPPAFARFVKDEISRLMPAGKTTAASTEAGPGQDTSDIPLPDEAGGA